jgi:hypothetical protein
MNGLNLAHVYANDVNLLEKNINTITKNGEIILQAREVTGLEVN